jgi:AhpC/TSA family
MYPHERSLVKRLEGKPFALLGINSDQSRDDLKKVLEKENITWRSWFDGGSTSGPIATKWNVQGWPTIYILDEKGIIRYKGARGEAMDKAVNTLLTKMGVKIEKEKSEEEPAKKGE